MSAALAVGGKVTKPRRWIVSARYDLFFFIGSCLITVAFYGLYRGAQALGWRGGAEVLLTYFVFTALFDHPHILQTFSRTHGDPAELARHRGLHTWGLAAFLLAGVAVIAFKWEAELIVVTAVYGTWHIVRQHAGLLRVYKRIHRDTSLLDDLLDYGTFYSGMLACLFTDYSGLRKPVWIFGQTYVLFPTAPAWVSLPLAIAFGVLAALLVARQLYLLATLRQVNVPKLLLLVASVGSFAFVFVLTATPFLVAEALETAYHNVQYQGWIMHYQQQRFRARAVVVKWSVCALVYGVVVGTLEILGFLRPALSWVFVPFAMLVLWHYFIDGCIWRMRESPELRDLLAPPRAAASAA